MVQFSLYVHKVDYSLIDLYIHDQGNVWLHQRRNKTARSIDNI